ncbi:hypothetical protein G6F29_001721 [Rhizopus arrhizus]|nr:hypothetical protein G6F18_001480 [Rhizopus arrhizus]KAG0902941.1 hypothetical protein G6F34_001584 [Rhizopus arrhizus]KAG0950605.1 hypothetical protein G6F30_001629 [Rhizopus arrhizus]KAG0988487.1 hypothetical protein G6F29_001721 [Rhizopus arrhizus]KAG0999386.1 hypothetical protein G6F28_001071 [Rhizopus arrhizus]
MLSAMSSLTYSIKPVGKETLSPNSPATTSNTPTEVEEMDTAEEIEETQEVSVEGSEEDEVLFFLDNTQVGPPPIRHPATNTTITTTITTKTTPHLNSRFEFTTHHKKDHTYRQTALQHPFRWYQTRRTTTTILSTMEKDNFTSLATLSCTRGLQDTIQQNTATVENPTVTLEPNRTTSKISPDQNTDYLSNFFTIQEPNKRRPILDCQKINQFIQCHHFKMEGVPALRELMEKNDYMCKLDLKDAYVVVGLHPQSRKYLTFMNQGVPRLSIQFHNHEDHSAYDKNQQIDQPNKTGFITTDENLQMRDLARSLQIHQQKWEAPFNLSSHSITELQWWINLVSSKNGLPIQRIENEQPAITIHVDASDIAWGVASPELETMGYWTNEEKGHSINVRELSAILFAIQLHAKKYKNSSGTSSPLLQDLAVKIQDICNQYKLKVEYHHIPGVNNIQAD